jgi:CRP-like cAMP-binding protein
MPTMPSTANILLSILNEQDAALLAPHLVTITLTHRQTLIQADTDIEHVYFLDDGVASIVSLFENGDEAEVGIVGREGMAGTAVLLGATQMPYRIYMQIDGTSAQRISVRALDDARQRSATLALLLLRYAQAAVVQTGHTAAVNAHFDIVRRLARWLLMCHDRSDTDSVAVTHEMLSIMLGVRRPGVTEAMIKLEELGFIRGSRGRADIIDRKMLEQFAGSAYGVAESQYRSLIAPFGKTTLS